MKNNRSQRNQCIMTLFLEKAALLNMNHQYPFFFCVNRNEGMIRGYPVFVRETGTGNKLGEE